jgi:uncharacterized membrane protein
MNPFNSVRSAIITGIVLAVLFLLLIPLALPAAGAHRPSELGIAIWLHILSGVMWVGLLYYFNVVQIPGMAAAAADTGGPGGAGVTRYIAPRALVWFRWSSLATWFTGMWYLGRAGNFMNALTLGHGGREYYGLIIGTGAWLGTIMLFNVWAVIWPNQKKILGLVTATDEQKASARPVDPDATVHGCFQSLPTLLICPIRWRKRCARTSAQATSRQP